MKNYEEFILNEIKSKKPIKVEKTIVNGQEIISFSINLNSKKFNIILFYSHLNGRIILQFFTSFHHSYSEPDVDFYLILDQFNMSCIMGNLFFTKEHEDYFISYRSNYVAEDNDFIGHSSFKEFLNASLTMIEKYDSEINIL